MSDSDNSLTETSLTEGSESENPSFEILEEFSGQRLDLCLSKLADKSRSKISNWISSGYVSVNGKLILKPAYKLEKDDLVNLIAPKPQNAEIIPDSSIKLDIVHEDENLLVINKQAGLVVHPAAGNWDGTLVNGLAAYLGKKLLNSSIRPGIVHRLDKDTSGLMVIAKTELALNSLSEQFLPPREIHREYLAVCSSYLPSEKGVIDHPIARDAQDRKKMSVSSIYDSQKPRGNSKKAVTNWEVVENYESKTSLVKLRLETGRTHQIRVHLESVRAAIIGDQKYGPKINSLDKNIRKVCSDFPRQALHACKLSFIDPASMIKSKEGKSKKRLTFQSDLPEDILNLTKKLERIN